MPVAADLEILDGGVIDGRHLEPRVHRRISGEQAALQHHGDVRRPLVKPCALERETRLGRAGAEEVALVALPGPWFVEAEPQLTGRAERERLSGGLVDDPAAGHHVELVARRVPDGHGDPGGAEHRRELVDHHRGDRPRVGRDSERGRHPLEALDPLARRALAVPGRQQLAL